MKGTVRCKKHNIDCILTPTKGEHWLFLCPICDKEKIEKIKRER